MAREIKHVNTTVLTQKTITYELEVDGEKYIVKDYYNVKGDAIEESTLYDGKGEMINPEEVGGGTLAADIYAFCDDEVEIDDKDLIMNPDEELPTEEPEEKPIEGEITGIPEGSTMSDTDDKK